MINSLKQYSPSSIFIVFCDNSKYHYFEEYITSINIHLKFVLVLYDENTINILIQKHKNSNFFLFIQMVPEYIDKNLLKNKNCIVINTEQYTMTHNNDLNCANNMIIDYSKENILYAKKNLNKKHYIFWPYSRNTKEIYNFQKIYDVCIVGNINKRRQKIIDDIQKLGIKVTVISDLFGIERDNILMKHKIVVNIHNDIDYKIYESIRCDRCLFNKMIIISEKSLFSKVHMLKKFIIFRKYENIPYLIFKILKKYNFYYQKIFLNSKFDNFVLKYDDKVKKIYNKALKKVFSETPTNEKYSINPIPKINKPNNNKNITFGFIIIRYVIDEITNKYWQECYKNIRKFYNQKIVIIDDNSDIKFLTNEIKLINCQIIKSEFPKRGEILGYYYLHKFKLFDKAIIIHDSVFIKKYINFEKYDKTIFFWSFNHDYDDDENILKIISKIKNNQDIIKLYNDKVKWSGCYGIMTITTWNSIDIINKKYDFFGSILPIVKSRDDRMALERIYACLCYLNNNLNPIPSILGNINEYCEWGLDYDDYLSGKMKNLPIVKVWTGR
jgi:hypothetical protein